MSTRSGRAIYLTADPNFDALPMAYPDRPDYRVLVVGGTLVAASVVIGQLVADDNIVLLGIELDLDWPPEQLE